MFVKENCELKIITVVTIIVIKSNNYLRVIMCYNRRTVTISLNLITLCEHESYNNKQMIQLTDVCLL